MTELMICPKAGECRDCKGAPWSDHSKPHEELSTCSDYRAKRFRAENHCPPCVPYKRELKVGDRVRVLGKTHGMGSHTLLPPCKIGDIGIVGELHPDYLVVNSSNMTHGNYFKREDLEHIGGEVGEKAKYKYAGEPATLFQFYKSFRNENCCEYYTHFSKLMWSVQVEGFGSSIPIDSLILWASEDGRRIKWLLEKGYIVEDVSAYDKWVGECPGMEKTDATPFVKWAKRMPRE